MGGFNFNYVPSSLKPLKITGTGQYIIDLGNSVNPFGQTSVWVFIGDNAVPPGDGTATFKLLTNDHTKEVYDASADNEADEWVNSAYGDITVSGKFVLQQPCQRLKIIVSALAASNYLRVVVSV